MLVVIRDAATCVVRPNALELYQAYALNLVLLVESGFLALHGVHYLCA